MVNVAEISFSRSATSSFSSMNSVLAAGTRFCAGWIPMSSSSSTNPASPSVPSLVPLWPSWASPLSTALLVAGSPYPSGSTSAMSMP